MAGCVFSATRHECGGTGDDAALHMMSMPKIFSRAMVPTNKDQTMAVLGVIYLSFEANLHRFEI